MNKVSDDLRKAISLIFENPEEGLIALGAIDSGVGLQRKVSLSSDLDPLERVRILQEQIKSWLKLYSEEIQEFDSDYHSLRIASEAKGLLLALREIHTCFPEVD